jgi:hypothetical protein
MNIKTTATTILILSAALYGCGSDDEAAKATQAVTPVVREAKPVDPTEKMARAVASGKTGAAVELKYDVLSKPEPGKPIEIDLAFIPSTVADTLVVNVTATPGLEVVANETANFGLLKIGEVAHHKITVRAERADVVYLTVVVTLNAVGVNSVRTFAIPLIVSDPNAPDAPASASVVTQAQMKTDATGQKIQSMPAQESK